MLISTYKDGLNILDGDIIDLYYLENISSYLNMFFENGNLPWEVLGKNK